MKVIFEVKRPFWYIICMKTLITKMAADQCYHYQDSASDSKSASETWEPISFTYSLKMEYVCVDLDIYNINLT